MDLSWMKDLIVGGTGLFDGSPLKVPASVLTLSCGRRVAVVCTVHVFIGVEIPDGDTVALPEYVDQEAPTGVSRREILEAWLAADHDDDVEVDRKDLAEWATAEASTRYGFLGQTLLDRHMVLSALAHAPKNGRTVRIGFLDPGWTTKWASGARLVVFAMPGYRAVVAPANPDGPHARGAPLLALSERSAA